jgi:ribosomal protein L11 methyltransferase
MDPKKQEQHWIEFSIEVNQDLADLVSNALIGLLPTGLVSERVFEEVFPHELDQITAPVRIYGFFPEEEDQLYRDKILDTLGKLRLKVDLPEPVFSALKNKNWAAAWQERYQPIPIGDRLIVVPSWLENPAQERIPLFIDPGMAFGSGTHETTQLSLALVEQCLTAQPEHDVIDVGCGSGILAIAAAKLGAERILGVDTDPEAIRVSRENTKKNHVSRAATYHVGSVTEILSGKLGLTQANLVVANIIAPILEELFEEGLGEIVASDGHLLLSGILIEQLPAILNRLEQGGFKVRTRLKKGEWVAVIADRIPA